MQSNGPLAASSQEFEFAVSPETKVVPQRDRTPDRREKSKLCLVLIALAISAVVPRAAHGATGTLTASLSSVSFGSVPVGSKSSQAILLKNTGGAALKLVGVSLSGAGFSQTGLVAPLALVLAPGNTVSVTVVFAPTTAGSVAGSLVLGSNATNSALAIPLSGTGVTATRTISLSATSLNFGNEVVGGTSTLTAAVKNTGNSSVTISVVSVSGTGFNAVCCFAGTTIAPGQTGELNVVFAPKVTGSVGGTVSIASNASNSPSTISLAGAGVSSTAHSVTLNWEASSSSNVIGYYVYRSTVSGGSYTRLTSSLVAALKYTDGAVSAGETYYYVVTAVNAGGTQSGYSGQVSATIP
jgi:hypothetical protein